MLLRGEDVIAGQIARLFFRCFSSSGAAYPYLTPEMIESGTVERRQTQPAGGNWISTAHLGEAWQYLQLTTDAQPLDPGGFIKHIAEDGKKNLYSIDVADNVVTDLWDTDAVRLKLTSGTLIFVPYIHRVVAG